MNHDEDRARSRRALERRTWPVRKGHLGDAPDDDISALTTPAQRLSMVWTLTLEAWALTGQPVPDYPRERTPIVIHRGPVAR